jgi:hypothetical protein
VPPHPRPHQFPLQTPRNYPLAQTEIEITIFGHNGANRGKFRKLGHLSGGLSHLSNPLSSETVELLENQETSLKNPLKYTARPGMMGRLRQGALNRCILVYHGSIYNACSCEIRRFPKPGILHYGGFWVGDWEKYLLD